MKTKTLPFEQAAERRTNIEGWVCKTCRRFWGNDERMARWCCAADLQCSTEGCKARVRKGGWTVCAPCRDRKAEERWLKLPEVPWDGNTPLCLADDDRYFFDLDDLDGFIEDHEGMKLEDLRLVICVPEKKPRFEVYDLLQDYLAEDMEADDSTEIEKLVKDWIEEHVPEVWMPGEARPTLGSLRT